MKNNFNLPDIDTKAAVTVRITAPLLSEKSLSLFIKREDLIHPYISGNKWSKLKYNLEEASRLKYDTLLSFGGAYSNHIYALAAAGVMFNFKTIGIIRGEEHLPLNPTLDFARSCGMNIQYMSRTEYRSKHLEYVIDQLTERYGAFYLVPEGGTNNLAVKGCSEIPLSIDIEYDYLCTAVGTGGTIAGLIKGVPPGIKILGFPVLKGAQFLEKEIYKLTHGVSVNELPDWQLCYDYHFGGYAKFNNELLNFIEEFDDNYQIPLDQVYTGKMIYGIFDLVRNNYFPEGSRIIAIHTGGLQGRLKSFSAEIRKG